MNTTEIECRFLEIDKEALIKKLIQLAAHDEGEQMLEETIIYDPELKWLGEERMVRLRKVGDKVKLTYKDQKIQTVDGTFELELTIDDYEKAELFFEKIGLRPFRRQQKKRHTFQLGDVTVDIDTWPRIPTYVELEGPSEDALKDAAKALSLDWKDANFHNARWVIENKYNIPVGKMTWFTFDRFE